MTRGGLAGLAACLVVVALGTPPPPGEPWGATAAAADPPATSRLAGDDRFATAAAIAAHAFPEGAPTVHLARADLPVDALAAGALTDGPTLLVPRCGETPAVVSETIATLDPERVVALGGERAVCEDVLLAAAQGRSTDRLGGGDRIETALAIARAAFPDGAPTLYVVAGTAGADAVVAGTLTGGPILLVPTEGGVPGGLRQAVEDLAPTRVVGVGGPAALPDDVLRAVAGDRPIDRLAGPDRYATAATVAGSAYPDGATRAYLARSDDLADAVVAGALTDGPVLLVPRCEGVPAATVEAVVTTGATQVVGLGGTQAVCDLALQRGASRPAPPPPTEVAQDADVLAATIAYAEGSIRGAEPATDWLAFAAESQQLAYRTLAFHEPLRDPVYARLPAHLIPVAFEQVTAKVELLDMLTTLKDEPPSTWRIVAPAPVEELRGYYAEAEAASGVPWYYLAAIHLVETRFSRIHGTSTAGAQGPMQFVPATWDAYGEGDVHDDHDAILAAGRYLRANGAPARMDQALYAYNHDRRYVSAVTRYALQLAADEDVLRGYHAWQVWYLTSHGDELLPVGWTGRDAT